METVLDPDHHREPNLRDVHAHSRHHGDHHHHAEFTVHVNTKPVKLTGHHHTGLQIKEAAIAQGLKIQLDFVLSEELSHGRSRIIGDDERIEVSSHSKFEAIPNDDHS